jgi:hypothetical protein
MEDWPAGLAAGHKDVGSLLGQGSGVGSLLGQGCGQSAWPRVWEVCLGRGCGWHCLWCYLRKDKKVMDRGEAGRIGCFISFFCLILGIERM